MLWPCRALEKPLNNFRLMTPFAGSGQRNRSAVPSGNYQPEYCHGGCCWHNHRRRSWRRHRCCFGSCRCRSSYRGRQRTSGWNCLRRQRRSLFRTGDGASVRYCVYPVHVCQRGPNPGWSRVLPVHKGSCPRLLRPQAQVILRHTRIRHLRSVSGGVRV